MINAFLNCSRTPSTVTASCATKRANPKYSAMPSSVSCAAECWRLTRARMRRTRSSANTESTRMSPGDATPKLRAWCISP
jgi:hypothetical protein